jgi:hypothetical protein
MADAFERVCSELENQTGYRPRGGNNQRKGICPAHSDDKPSLSIRNDQKVGLVGVTCFAGCTFEQIVEALGLEPRDFRNNTNGHRVPTRRTPGAHQAPTDSRGGLGKELARYPYTDEAGNVLYYNVRFEPKDFRMAGPDGKVKRLPPGLVRVPYNLPKVLAAVAAGQTVYWVEGEKDVATLAGLDRVATTSAGGANSPVDPVWATYFNGADVVVVADRDKPGRDYARSVSRLLVNQANRVRLAEPAVPQPKSDVTDHLAAGYGLDQLDWQSMRSIRRVRWSVAEILATKPEPLRWVLPGVIPEGLTLLVGAPKAGKSWFNMNLMVALATGRPQEVFAWGQTIEPSPNLYLALEDPHRRVHDRLHKIIRGLDFPARQAGEIWLDLPPITEGGRDEIERWLERNPSCRAIMVDVLAKVRTAPESGGGLYQADYEAVGVLKDIADDYGIGVVVTHHDRKRTDEDFLNMVSGTKGITGAADTILYLKRERGSDDGTLQCESRDVEECTYVVQFVREQGRWHIIERKDPGSDTSAPEMSVIDQISQVILTRGETTQGDLAEILKIELQVVKRMCAQGESKGYLAQTVSGLWYVPKEV